MLEQYFSLPRQQKQYHRKNYRQQLSCEEGKYPGSACPNLLRTLTKLGLRLYEHGRLRERQGVLCGSQSVSKSLQHLLAWTDIPLVKF